ncbi:hypothetical protein HPP92_002438 [Vanilla planifolia]|uniref:PHD-type domain-containing protein n=1 Tax=Vanilla planifolia TaxID=51239 RepID=A0A835S6B6_VANPL|nr:hypothetical protein HPP92_002438 [Vanilla planifolia]
MVDVDPAGVMAAGGTSGGKNEHLLIRSTVRTGLKRELAFALKSQAEVSANLGRTRLRKPPSSPFPAAVLTVSGPPVKKVCRRRSAETFSAGLRTSDIRFVPVKADSSAGALVVDLTRGEGHPGSVAENPIVVDDVAVAHRVEAPENVSVGAGDVNDSVTMLDGGLIIPSWLEKQVSRITQAGNKFMMQDTVEGGSDGSFDATTSGFMTDANQIIRLSSPESVLDSIESTSRDIPSHERSGGKLTKKDVGLHKLVFMEDVLPEGTLLQYVVHGSPKLIGYAKGCGIYCTCCNEVVSPSQFEAHAGQAQRRKPYNNIYTSNGVSLHELSVTLSKRLKLLDSDNDDLCSICKDAGELLLCDLCPRAFHLACVGLSSLPEGDWHCHYCENMHQRENYVTHNDNARAAGRVPGVDAVDQILKRCILIVKVPDARVGGCALCRSKDYTKSGFCQRTVMICDQCEKEYHVGCLKNHGMDDLKEKPQGDWFCCADCAKVYTGLQDVTRDGAQALPGLANGIIKLKDNGKISNENAGVDLKWRLFRGKTASASDKLLLSKAVSVLHESFDPIIGGKKGADLVTQMVFGRWWQYMDFQGMYCAILTVDSSVVSVGILRILGSEAAEIPLVATRKESQGQGYFGALFTCMGKLLASLNVKHLVLPATAEAEPMWTNKFGFKKISIDQLHELVRGIKIVNFEGTTLLHRNMAELLEAWQTRNI